MVLIKNIETERVLVNGARGQIVGFVEADARSRGISLTRLSPEVRFLCGGGKDYYTRN